MENIDLAYYLPLMVPGCEFVLSQSTPPHSIIYWRANNTKMPSYSEIQNFVSKNPYPMSLTITDVINDINILKTEIEGIKEKLKKE